MDGLDDKARHVICWRGVMQGKHYRAAPVVHPLSRAPKAAAHPRNQIRLAPLVMATSDPIVRCSIIRRCAGQSTLQSRGTADDLRELRRRIHTVVTTI